MAQKAFIDRAFNCYTFGVLAALITGSFFTSLKRSDARRKGIWSNQWHWRCIMKIKKYPSALTFDLPLSDPVSKNLHAKVPDDPISERIINISQLQTSQVTVFTHAWKQFTGFTI
jgi:hypothetical protein